MKPLECIASVQDAAKLWNLNPDHLKRLCEQGRVEAVKLGKMWIIDITQPNPSRYRKRASSES